MNLVGFKGLYGGLSQLIEPSMAKIGCVAWGKFDDGCDWRWGSIGGGTSGGALGFGWFAVIQAMVKCRLAGIWLVVVGKFGTSVCWWRTAGEEVAMVTGNGV